MMKSASRPHFWLSNSDGKGKEINIPEPIETCESDAFLESEILSALGRDSNSNCVACCGGRHMLFDDWIRNLRAISTFYA